MVRARQAVITEPFKTTVREVELPDPAPNQILLAAEYSAVSAGTELAVYTGTHQWLKDPNLPDWKFPFRSGYSAAGRVLKVGKDFPGGFQEGDRVSFPGNHASAELLHRRPRAVPRLEDAGQSAVREGRAGRHRPLRPRRVGRGPGSRSAVRRRCWGWASSASSRCGA